MDKKKLTEAYKQSKPDMGVYVYICKPTQKAYLGYGQNLKGNINSITFQLNLGSFISNTKCALQKDWSKYGETNFEVTILEVLEYDKDESKTDYQADLRILRELCSERFSDFEFIQN